ncbi:DUF6445 family protein, partial [Escherichia coli]|uniref:DUF6445 family protein n=1 Tax=Escherichia coli TaxID=562 RepID=UPI0034D2FF24
MRGGDAGLQLVEAEGRAAGLARAPAIIGIDFHPVRAVRDLAPDGGDGTGFFRHRATGFETIDAARSAGYLATLNAELRAD